MLALRAYGLYDAVYLATPVSPATKFQDTATYREGRCRRAVVSRGVATLSLRGKRGMFTVHLPTRCFLYLSSSANASDKFLHAADRLLVWVWHLQDPNVRARFV